MANINFDPSRLYTLLLNTGLQSKDNPTYQVIYQLIGQLARLTTAANTSSGSSSSSSQIINNELRMLGFDGLDGDNGIDGFPGLQGIQGPAGSIINGYWTLLTDGNIDETDFIFANGDPISLFVPV